MLFLHTKQAPQGNLTSLVGKEQMSNAPYKCKKNNIMSQSLCKIYLHIVFHIKTSSPNIDEKDFKRVHSYIRRLVDSTGCYAIQVGGIGDHVHIVCSLSRKENVAHLVEELKRNSSRWLKTISLRYKDFAWQGGYGAFSVSQSVVDKTIEYVRNQKVHHQKQSFKEEYLRFLELYHIEYDEQHLFSD